MSYRWNEVMCSNLSLQTATPTRKQSGYETSALELVLCASKKSGSID